MSNPTSFASLILRTLLAFSLLTPAACKSSAPVAAPPATNSVTASPAPGKYIAPDAIDVRALLPDPPAPNSPISNGEIEIILAAQSDASQASRARAIEEDTMKVWLFADILGPSFNAGAKPKTAAFIKQIERDSHAISDRAKKIWNRPRPYAQDPRIKLNTDAPGNNSYPSGHATRGAAWTEVLCLLVPDQAEALRARGRLIGFDRIILGVHFPSDVAAGNALGKAIVEQMRQSPAFQQDLADAQSEWPTPR
ncbi:MAG: phosphatase PAP2 family protein [Phycisphaeraceae bacterium]|nr:phosphatase PAP2 family protein [Phycisphaeraceae bacterium]